MDMKHLCIAGFGALMLGACSAATEPAPTPVAERVVPVAPQAPVVDAAAVAREKAADRAAAQAKQKIRRQAKASDQPPGDINDMVPQR
jgi:hypothetical protein